MANPTTNYGFIMPSSTDLVTDLPADFDVFGQAVDTQMLTNANAAIAKAIVDAKGDLISATGADTPARLAVGANGTVLTADSGETTGLKWATPGGGLTLISATSCTAVSSQSVTGFSATYNNYKIIFSGDGTVNDSVFIKLRLGAVDSSTAYYGYTNRYFSSNATQTATYVNGTSGFEVAQSMAASVSVIDVLRPYEAKRTSIIAAGSHFNTGNSVSTSLWTSGTHNVETSYDGFTLNWFTSSFTGTIYLYGYQAA